MRLCFKLLLLAAGCIGPRLPRSQALPFLSSFVLRLVNNLVTLLCHSVPLPCYPISIDFLAFSGSESGRLPWMIATLRRDSIEKGDSRSSRDGDVQP
ncbi:hypothetical protein F5884DRAFT_462025 [Xylogone sp. PMI_703]|nr:hypothetical protein F5884DRAFT_462025 [Xylogone sp. PMI_703]